MEKEPVEQITELRQALIQQEQLLALLSHDIRSPLSAIIGFVKLVKEYPMPLAEQDAILNKVLNAAKQIDKMVTDLLDSHKIRNGKLKPHLSSFAAHDLINRVLEERNLASWAEQKGVKLICNLDVVTLRGDEMLLASVIQNLVSNAIKFCRSGDRVMLTVKKSDISASITVEDNGVGMDGEKIQKIFAFHEPTSTKGTNGEKGNGFGLPLCREIIKAHGGRIEVASEPGNGSTFTVVLPN